jgi:hypothetical protein
MLKNFPVPTLACWTSTPINSSSFILMTVSLLSWAIPWETSVVILGAEGAGGWGEVHSGEFVCHLVVEHLGQADATCGFMTFDHIHTHRDESERL